MRVHGFSCELSQEGEESCQCDFDGQGNLYVLVKLLADHDVLDLQNAGVLAVGKSGG